jgi:hypothetical protein
MASLAGRQCTARNCQNIVTDGFKGCLDCRLKAREKKGEKKEMKQNWPKMTMKKKITNHD